MLSLHDLSAVGFGGYRIDRKDPYHRRALTRALAAGCNLVDTSANYTQGESEALIGEVTSTLPPDAAFVVTKAGYAQGANLAILDDIRARSATSFRSVDLGGGAHYSIEPEYLRNQLSQSLVRLKRSFVDGFLLHNPEHLLGGSPLDVYDAIRQAFAMLEEEVQRKRIRFYGLSSNALARGPGDGNLDLRLIADVARELSASNHFRIVEFPLNLVEQDATQPYYDGETLIQVIRREGLTSLSNRPLNAERNGIPCRLVEYSDASFPASDDALFERCHDLLQDRLRRDEYTEDVMDLTVMRFLRDSWRSIASPDLVEQVFRGHVAPLLKLVYGKDFPSADREAFRALRAGAHLNARRLLAKEAAEVRRELSATGVIARGDVRALPLIGCDYSLNAGVDHVLVGMRRPEYVDEIQSLFRRAVAASDGGHNLRGAKGC